jgi:hypothetical protein
MGNLQHHDMAVEILWKRPWSRCKALDGVLAILSVCPFVVYMVWDMVFRSWITSHMVVLT